MTKRIDPSIRETAFNCPHCGALTTQTWHTLSAAEVVTENRLPPPAGVDMQMFATLMNDPKIRHDQKVDLNNYMNRVRAGEIILDRRSENGVHPSYDVTNLLISSCYNCHGLAVWKQSNMLFPPARHGVEPNSDLDEEIQHDFDEARAILDLSPRGAAALLRLALQKLCVQLGEEGKNIDRDIASLVAKGLNPIVQKALDIVRVIGNESVHPGTFDLRDDRDTALKLFGLINAIAEQMISHPKQVEALYGKLPADKLAGIEARNAKAVAAGPKAE